MYVVLVHVEVKKENILDFIIATKENAFNSLQEPGIEKFDILQDIDDESKFILIEGYKKKGNTIDHKNTSHYMKWRDCVESMMAKPRFSVKYTDIDSSEK